MRTVHRRLLLIGAVAACVGGAAAFPVLASDGSAAVKVTAATGKPVPGQYIVTLKAGASPDATAKKVKAAGVRRFDGVLNGFAARLTGDQLGKLQHDSRVAAIEQDQVISVNTTQKAPLSWGLDRIDQRSRTLSKSYTYKSTGSGVNAYVIDTGLDVTHPNFGGRASIAWWASSFSDGVDCNGHGTHVAGTIGSKTYGVAKNVNLRALRILDCDGYGYMSDIVEAANWLRGHAAKPAVANLSVGGPSSAAVNTAVANLSKSGVFVTVAAGNDNKDACKFSPSGASWVMTVGATTVYDNRADFSNWGKCVDINAPGYSIPSTWPGGGTKSLSGTSMAAPHVTGVAALYLSTHKTATFAQVQKWLNDNSTHSLKRLKQQPNRLVYKSSL
ncbi:S8 family peptidase [Actinomadura decatromicini]|uniref:S8 family peptidase n=1 Tax=Actinomadura decatromicini TaxID=2604572 RepID=A0A5D3FPZ6_9ACTN|nr:S8 family peptidase [Actinomadura decatromicini]TYK50897.1 S8 family peptidase [Actinomadura decatromicini]